MFKRLAPFATVLATLSGCATPIPQYSLPQNVPSVRLKSSITGAHELFESIDIFLFDSNGTPSGNRMLFSIKGSVSKPTGYVQVPANVPLKLVYSEVASAGRFCKLNISVTLEQGKSYSLVGGFAYEKGPIPILTGIRKCQFGVIDEATKMLVPYR